MTPATTMADLDLANTGSTRPEVEESGIREVQTARLAFFGFPDPTPHPTYPGSRRGTMWMTR